KHDHTVDEVNLQIKNNEDVNLIEVNLCANCLILNQNMELLKGIKDKNFLKGIVERGFMVPHNSDNVTIPIAYLPYNNLLEFWLENNSLCFEPKIKDNNCSYNILNIGFVFTYKLEDEKKYHSITIPPKDFKHIHRGKHQNQRENEIILDNIYWID
ncbi:MAG: hypothetical protein Q8R87_05885, partial [Anaerolineaceae bacterium]|nr:hypothetical protein [Anaerolineaceae bacterium]